MNIYQRSLEVAVISLVVVIILLLTADDPYDGDELLRGFPSGIGGALAGWFARGLMTGQSDAKHS